MDTSSVFSAADGLGIHRLSVDDALGVFLRLAAQFFRRDQFIDSTSKRFFGRVAEDACKFRINPYYAVFNVEKDDALRRLFKKLIELRLLYSQLLGTSQ